MLAIVSNTTNFSLYSLPKDIKILNDYNSFSEDVALEIVQPQEVIVDGSEKEIEELLVMCGFTLIPLWKYRIPPNAVVTEVDVAKHTSVFNHNIEKDTVTVQEVLEEKTSPITQEIKPPDIEVVKNVSSAEMIRDTSTTVNTIPKDLYEDTDDEEEVLTLGAPLDTSNRKSVPKNKYIENTNKKSSLFNKLFKRNKEDKVNEIVLDSSIAGMSKKLGRDFTRGAIFKDHIVKHKYLTREQVSEVESYIEQHQRFGKEKKFIQACRDLKLLDEDTCAKLLSFSTKQEVLSMSALDLDELGVLNINLKCELKDFFIYKIDDESKRVYICKDLSSKIATYKLEKFYMGYTIIVSNVVEGVTSEVIKSLDT